MSNILNIGKNEVKNQNWRDYLLYEPVVLKKFSIVYTISFLVNCLVFPAMFFQMMTTYKRQGNRDFSIFFTLLQFFGGAPEGMTGAILAHLNGNFQMLLVGLYAMFYNAFMTFFGLFSRDGLILDMYAKSEKKLNNK